MHDCTTCELVRTCDHLDAFKYREANGIPNPTEEDIESSSGTQLEELLRAIFGPPAKSPPGGYIVQKANDDGTAVEGAELHKLATYRDLQQFMIDNEQGRYRSKALREDGSTASESWVINEETEFYCNKPEHPFNWDL